MVAVASRSEDKANAFITAMNLDQAKPYTYDSIITNANLDALYIPLPTGLHKEWVQKATAAKIHILLEKPVALVSLGHAPSQVWKVWLLPTTEGLV